MNAPHRAPIGAAPAAKPAGSRRARLPAAASTQAPAVPDRRIARGHDTRARLRSVALRLFAEKGYAQTSTREICTEAAVNAAAIHYYFTDKAGLYREVYLAPILQLLEAAVAFARMDAPFETVMRRSYEAFLAPLRHEDEKTMQILKLHFREHADPTGLVGDQVEALVQTHLDAIAQLLCRETGAAAPDDDLRRLAASLVALAADFLTNADRMRRLAPRLYDGAEAIDRMTDRLTGYAVAMLDYERKRRADERSRRTGAARAVATTGVDR